MFNREFILVLERWVVAPIIGMLIIHGLVDPKDSALLTQLSDQFLGTAVIIVAYIVTHHHSKTTVTTEQTTGTPASFWLWDKVKGLLFTKTTVTTEDPPQQ